MNPIRQIACGLASVAIATLLIGCAKSDPIEQPNETRAWLDLQRSGSAAAESRGALAEATERAEDRYLESFSQALPDPPDDSGE